MGWCGGWVAGSFSLMSIWSWESNSIRYRLVGESGGVLYVYRNVSNEGPIDIRNWTCPCGEI